MFNYSNGEQSSYLHNIEVGSAHPKPELHNASPKLAQHRV